MNELGKTMRGSAGGTRLRQLVCAAFLLVFSIVTIAPGSFAQDRESRAVVGGGAGYFFCRSSDLRSYRGTIRGTANTYSDVANSRDDAAIILKLMVVVSEAAMAFFEADKERLAALGTEFDELDEEIRALPGLSDDAGLLNGSARFGADIYFNSAYLTRDQSSYQKGLKYLERVISYGPLIHGDDQLTPSWGRNAWLVSAKLQHAVIEGQIAILSRNLAKATALRASAAALTQDILDEFEIVLRRDHAGQVDRFSFELPDSGKIYATQMSNLYMLLGHLDREFGTTFDDREALETAARYFEYSEKYTHKDCTPLLHGMALKSSAEAKLAPLNLDERIKDFEGTREASKRLDEIITKVWTALDLLDFHLHPVGWRRGQRLLAELYRKKSAASGEDSVEWDFMAKKAAQMGRMGVRNP